MSFPASPISPPSCAAEALAMAEAAYDYLNAADLPSLPMATQAECLKSWARVEAKRAAAEAGLVAAFWASGGAAADGQKSVAAWLTRFGRCTRPAARGMVAASFRVREHRHVEGALAEGEVSPSYARWIGEAVGRFDPADRDAVEEILVQAAASGAMVEDLEKVAVAAQRRLSPGGVERDEAAAHADRGLTLSKTIGGVGRLNGDLDAEATALTQTVIDALAVKAGPEDDRTARQRRHDALAEALRRLLASDLLPERGGAKPHLKVDIDLATLRALPGAQQAEDAWITQRTTELTTRRINGATTQDLLANPSPHPPNTNAAGFPAPDLPADRRAEGLPATDHQSADRHTADLPTADRRTADRHTADRRHTCADEPSLHIADPAGRLQAHPLGGRLFEAGTPPIRPAPPGTLRPSPDRPEDPSLDDPGYDGPSLDDPGLDGTGLDRPGDDGTSFDGPGFGLPFRPAAPGLDAGASLAGVGPISGNLAAALGCDSVLTPTVVAAVDRDALAAMTTTWLRAHNLRSPTRPGHDRPGHDRPAGSGTPAQAPHGLPGRATPTGRVPDPDTDTCQASGRSDGSGHASGHDCDNGQDSGHLNSDDGGGAAEPGAGAAAGFVRLQETMLRWAIEALSGPGGLASYLRTQVLDGPLNAPSIVLDVGADTRTIPAPL
ncbi:MAG TPA: DUF222 domain-containing protein, partial [Streptosporangiaceae bacterium]